MLKFENHCPLRGFPFPHIKALERCLRVCPCALLTPIFLGAPFAKSPPSRRFLTFLERFLASLQGYPTLWAITSDSAFEWFPFRSSSAFSPSGFPSIAPYHPISFSASASSCSLLEHTCPSLLTYSSSVLHINTLPLRHLPIFILLLPRAFHCTL